MGAWLSILRTISSQMSGAGGKRKKERKNRALARLLAKDLPAMASGKLMTRHM